MLDTYEIKELLESGEEVKLTCIDEHAFINSSSGFLQEENSHILDRELIVDRIEIDNLFDNEIYIKGCDISIIQDEFKYFAIKDNKPTFNDLIDIVFQAHRDGYIKKIRLEGDVLDVSFNVDGDGLCGFLTSKTKENSYHFQQYIQDIKTLCSETFVINSQNDFSKINHNDNKTRIVLSNGELVNDDIWDMLKNYSGVVQLSILKGATVIQKRGAHD